MLHASSHARCLRTTIEDPAYSDFLQRTALHMTSTGPPPSHDLDRLVGQHDLWQVSPSVSSALGCALRDSLHDGLPPYWPPH